MAFRIPLGIRARLTIWFVLGAVGAVVLGSIVVYFTGVSSIQGTLGQTYCQIASRIVGQFENQFLQETSVIRQLATDVLTTEVALEADENYRGLGEAADQFVADRIAAWSRAGDTKSRRLLQHRQLTHRLTVLAGLRGNAVIRLTVYDARGLVIAASLPPERRTAVKSPWFRAVSTFDRHFTYADLSDKDGVLTAVMPVWGGVEIVGYVVGELDYGAFASGIENIRFGGTGEVVVVDYAGVPLNGEARQFLIQALSQRPPEPEGEPAGSVPSPYWVATTSPDESAIWQRLACVAPVPTVNALRARFELPPWSIVVTQSPQESYSALRNTLGSFAAAGFLGIFVVGLGGAFIAWHIASPLKDLQDGVRRFARGERDRHVEVAGTDEIGELAAEFNRMADRVTASENELHAFAQAVADATDAIMMSDPQGMIYYCNPAFEAVTGYDVDEVRGARPSLLKSELTPEAVYQQMWRAVIGGQAWRGELWNRRKNGESYPVDLSISPIHDENGQVVSLLGIHRDITLAREYQNRLEQEVQARTREIAETQGLTAMGRMASMIAHDLRNALSTVKMNLQILFRTHSKSGGVEEEYCEMGLEQVGYMEEILRDMLTFARPERLRADWHNLLQLIDEALAADAHLIAQHQVIVTTTGDKGLPTVYCDRVKILEVVRNLVENAIMAMSDGGEIHIGAHLVIDQPTPLLQVVIADNGGGIGPEDLEQVFEPFFTTRAKGTGLGMAIVKRIIVEHGGEIDIESTVDEGTTVKFTLPTAPADT